MCRLPVNPEMEELLYSQFYTWGSQDPETSDHSSQVPHNRHSRGVGVEVGDSTLDHMVQVPLGKVKDGFMEEWAFALVLRG